MRQRMMVQLVKPLLPNKRKAMSEEDTRDPETKATDVRIKKAREKSNAYVFVGIMLYISLLSVIIPVLIITGFERSVPIVASCYAGFGVLAGVLAKLFWQAQSTSIRSIQEMKDTVTQVQKNTNGNLHKERERADSMTEKALSLVDLVSRLEERLSKYEDAKMGSNEGASNEVSE